MRHGLAVVLVGCSPFEPPPVIVGGVLHLGGDPASKQESMHCQWTGAPGDMVSAMACEGIGVPEVAPTRIDSWDLAGDGSPWLLWPAGEAGMQLCRLDRSECHAVDLGPAPADSVDRFVATGDLDGDGLEDLVLGGMLDADYARQPPKVCWSSGRPDTISCETLPADTNRDSGVAVGDLDHDGDEDDIFIGALDIDAWNDVPWMCLGLGDRTFDCETWAPEHPDNSPSTLNSATAGDLNGDGTSDLLLAWDAQHNPQPSWCVGEPLHPATATCIDTPRNDIAVPQFYYEGTGTWLHEAPEGFSLADIDLDGDADLVGLSRMGLLYTCENDGLGGFRCVDGQKLLETASSDDNLGLADIDGDGDIDVVAQGTASDGNWHVFVCENQAGALECGELPDGTGLRGMALLSAVVD